MGKGVSFREREHWEDLISKRISNKIDSMIAEEDPLFIKRTEAAAEKAAITSLGLTKQMTRYHKIEGMVRSLRDEQEEIKKQMNKAVKGVINSISSRWGHNDYQTAIDLRAKNLKPGILKKSKLGRRILALEKERANLKESVGLATSTTQIKELWSEVSKMLELKPTQLEKKALEIDPIDAACCEDD